MAQKKFLEDKAGPDDLALLQRVCLESGALAAPRPALGNPALAGSTPLPREAEAPAAPADPRRPAAVIKPAAPKGGRLKSIND
jgi:hypothetical protein